MITLTETHVVSDHNGKIPRFAKLLPNTLIVPEGETVVLPQTSSYDAIEVAGTLKVSREHDTKCEFIHMTILPTGKLDMGTAEDPVLKNVEFKVKDVPFDFTVDPTQWGNGIINMGTMHVYGKKLDKTWVTMQEVEVGATELTLTEVPAGWNVGDSLLVPDTRQPYKVEIRRESPVTITAISGNVISLSKPLDFEHKAARDPDGNVKYIPYVANATRNINIVSENPQGTRGHIIHIESALADVRYATIVGLGRTLAVNIDNTTFDADGNVLHIGTNQIGRYAFHWHHVHNHSHVDVAHPHFGHIVGCFLDGNNISKWGIVVHGTHDTHVSDNVCDGFVGGGVTTEDGNEIRNVIERNFVMGSTGNGIDGKFNFVPPRFIPGGEGAGFWFHGMMNVIRNNVSINNAIGYQFLYRNQINKKVPSVPGGPDDMDINPTKVIPIECYNNVGACNKIAGVETWNNPVMTTVNELHLWYNGSIQYKAGNGEPGHVYAKNLYILGDNIVTTAISTSAAYTSTLDIENGEILGCLYGPKDCGSLVSVKNMVLQNKYNIYFVIRPRGKTILENVLHKQYKTEPKNYFYLTDVIDWQPGMAFPRRVANWYPNDGQRYIVKNHQQNQGEDYLIFEPYSIRSKPAFAGDTYCPEEGLTMGECWDKYGMAYGGGVIADADIVNLEGFNNTVAKAGLDYQVGPSKVILNTPNKIKPTIVRTDGKVNFNFTRTGENQFVHRGVYIQVDDGDMIYVQPNGTAGSGEPYGTRIVNKNYTVDTTPGVHTVKTWAVDENKQLILASEMNFLFFFEGEQEHPPMIESLMVSSQSVVQGEMVTLTAVSVSDEDDNLDNVEFFVDNMSLGKAIVAPFELMVDTTNLAVGSHTFSAVATDTTNRKSNVVTATVEILPAPPTCEELLVELQAVIANLESGIVEKDNIINGLQMKINAAKEALA